MSRYSYEAMWNGLTCEIFRDGESVAFLQGDDATYLLDQIEQCANIHSDDTVKADEVEQHLLSTYDY